MAKITSEQEATAKRLLSEGVSMRRVSEIIGKNYQTVYRKFRHDKEGAPMMSITIRVPSKWLDVLQSLADKDQVSVGSLCRDALIAQLKQLSEIPVPEVG
jgi:hypothetical protein